ncbi:MULTISPECIES: endonuclease toxin domain-containing protein [Cupriavidus]
MPPGSRLPPNFKTFDFYDEATGIATSAKTLDTMTEAKIANPAQIYSSLKGNIDAVADFTQASLGGVVLREKAIVARQLQVAVPSGTTQVQWQQIDRAIQYGQSLGIKVIVTPVK